MSALSVPPAAPPSADHNLINLRTLNTWLPLPSIAHGCVVHPFRPSLPPPTPNKNGESSRAAAYRNRFSWSGLDGGLAAVADGIANSGSHNGSHNEGNPYEVPLELGDEVFAFEEYRTSRDRRVEVWYRGYVVQATSLSAFQPLEDHPSSTYSAPRPEPSVLIGVFPSSCVHLRHTGMGQDEDGALAAHEAAMRMLDAKQKKHDEKRNINTVLEEDETAHGPSEASLTLDKGKGPAVNGTDRAFNMGESEGVVSTAKRRSLPVVRGLGRSNRPLSLDLGGNGLREGERDKSQPPLPRMVAGDTTRGGSQWPLVDEIACAVREWYGRLPTYLANREYRLFNHVIQHIDALLLGRRQLLSQTLSTDELSKVRRECVSRLVKCNIAQGLEVIVRNVEDGSVVITDSGRAFDGVVAVSGIDCYAEQIRFAYIDSVPLTSIPRPWGSSFGQLSHTRGLSNLTTPSSKVSHRLSSLATPTHAATDATSARLFQLVLDMRAFVASPCAPGEFAGLYFSIYDRRADNFITEEFCLILNHLGAPARDTERRLGRLRTIFTDLKPGELDGQLFLVCRLVRNGALKMSIDYDSSSFGRTSGSIIGRSTLTSLRSPSIATLTEDSFSVTGSYSARRTVTNDTRPTSTSTPGEHSAARRPLGCAVIELTQLKHLSAHGPTTTEGIEVSMPIYVPKNEAAFASLHRAIIDQEDNTFAASPKAQAIAINLRLLAGPSVQVTRANPVLLLDIPHTLRLGFSDMVRSGESRHDLYLKLTSGTFSTDQMPSSGSIRTRRSIIPSATGDYEIGLELRRSDGLTVTDALFAGGSGEAAMQQYQSLVFHQNDRPIFGELLKATLPVDMATCHLFLTIRSKGRERHHATDTFSHDNLHGFAFLPLVDHAEYTPDGEHHLIVYRATSASLLASDSYLSLPSTEAAEQQLDRSIPVVPLFDRIVVQTSLVSTVHSQDPTVRALLRTQYDPPAAGDVQKLLKVFTFVNEEEIAKYPSQILDALLGIASSVTTGDPTFATLCFQALIKVFSMSSDRRFPSAVSVLEGYIDNEFKMTASSTFLLTTIRSILSKPDSQDCRAFLKVWHLFFRLLIRCRALQNRQLSEENTTTSHSQDDFQRQLKSILQDLDGLVASAVTSVGTKTLIVQNYPGLLPGLSGIFQAEGLAEIVISFVDSLIGATGSIISYKMLLLAQIIDSIMDTTSSRALFIPALVRWIKPHLGKYMDIGGPRLQNAGDSSDTRYIKWLETNRLAVGVMARLVQSLHGHCGHTADRQEASGGSEEDLEYCLTLLPPLVQSYTEQASPAAHACISRARNRVPTVFSTHPDVFPSTSSASLVTDLPPLSLLFRKHQSEDAVLLHPGTFHLAQAETAAVIASLILVCSEPIIGRWLNETLEIEGLKATSSLLQALFTFSTSVIRSEVFPESWINLSLLCFGAITRLLEPVSILMEKPEFIPPANQTISFDFKLWTQYLGLVCDILDSDTLSLEEHGAQRRRAEWIICGDMRDEMAEILYRSWTALGWPNRSDVVSQAQDRHGRYGGYQTRFTGMSDRILSLCLSSHDYVMETASDILFSMIHAEYFLDGKLDSIQSRIFANLDMLFSSKSTDNSAESALRAYFVTVLRNIHESSPPPSETAHQAVGEFLDQIEAFIDLLIALRALPNRTEWAPDRKSILHSLMEFALSMNRRDLYARFCTQIIQLCIETKDHLSAGLAMKSLADSYSWNALQEQAEEFKLDRVALPIQTGMQRKEALLHHAIDFFAESEAYELILATCADLVAQHQSDPRDVGRISRLLRYQADVWDKIGQSTRVQPLYFRFARFVDSAPAEDFVVRGEPYQRYVDYCESMMLKYPTATLHRSKIPPSDIMRGNGQDILWITTLNPEPEASRSILQNEGLESVQAWWRHNDLKMFSSSRPYVLDPEDTGGALVWTEKTIIETANNLPNLLGRSEVINVTYEQISPIRSASNEVRRAIRTLQAAIVFRPGAPLDVKHLGTVINGAVDSPVNGGVSKYRQIFLSTDYSDRHPGDTEKVEELKIVILDYVRAIQEALGVHRLVCQDLTFHEALRSHFLRAYPDEIAILAKSEGPHSPPVPPKDSRQLAKIHVHSPSLHLISDMPTSISPAYQLPPLRLGPSPKTIPIGIPFISPTPSTTSSPPITIHRQDSDSIRDSMSGGQNGARSLAHRASSIIGSFSSRSSKTPSIERAESVGTAPSTIGGDSAKERRSSALSETSQQTVGEGGSARMAGSNSLQPEIKAERRLSIKRLSGLIRRSSKSPTGDRIEE